MGTHTHFSPRGWLFFTGILSCSEDAPKRALKQRGFIDEVALKFLSGRMPGSLKVCIYMCVCVCVCVRVCSVCDIYIYVHPRVPVPVLTHLLVSAA